MQYRLLRIDLFANQKIPRMMSSLCFKRSSHVSLSGLQCIHWRRRRIVLQVVVIRQADQLLQFYRFQKNQNNLLHNIEARPSLTPLMRDLCACKKDSLGEAHREKTSDLPCINAISRSRLSSSPSPSRSCVLFGVGKARARLFAA